MKSTMLSNMVVLMDERGRVVSFELLDLIEYSGEEYVVLLPTDDEEETEEVVVLMLEGTLDDGSESYVSVESEQTLQAVFEIFEEKLKKEHDKIGRYRYVKGFMHRRD